MGVEFSQEIFDKICDRIAEGESLRSVCRDQDMPSTSGVMKWLNKDSNGDLVEQYARAMDMRADTMFDELLHIADTPVVGEKTKTDKDGNTETHAADMIEHRRLQVDARKWVLARMKPKKYGDKLEHDHGNLVINLHSDAKKL